MPDIPAIFDAVRRHDPTIIPSWAENRTKSPSRCFFDYRAERPIRPECMEVMLVGWLFKPLDEERLNGVHCNARLDGGGYWVGWRHDREKNYKVFGPTMLGCILALCHAIGIEVADG